MSLPGLIELKLASGKDSGRRKDLGDVQEVIRALQLSLDFQQELDSSLRETYRVLWNEVQNEGLDL